MANKTKQTWSHLLGPVCIFLDREWKNGQLVEVKKDHVVYSISGDITQYLMTKDEAYKIIRKRNTLKTSDKTGAYTGKNPMVFGPDGKNIYGKKVVERKDRPGFYRVEVKYRPQKYAKVKNVKISLGKHASFDSAASVADNHINEWLINRTKHASSKRKRGRWITKKGVRKLTPTKCNTPKRVTTTATRRTRRTASAVTTPDKKIFSPLAPTMLRTPVAKAMQNKEKAQRRVKKKKKEIEPDVCIVFIACLFLPLPVCFFQMFYVFLFFFLKRAAHLKEIRRRAKAAVQKRLCIRVAKYKVKLRKNLPPQIEAWSKREKRLIAAITGAVPLDALLVRECPDPPVEVDPDTDEEETKTNEPTTTLPEGKLDGVDDDDDNDDPTTRSWTKNEECKWLFCHLLSFMMLTPSLHSHSCCYRVGDIPETAFTLACTDYGNE